MAVGERAGTGWATCANAGPKQVANAPSAHGWGPRHHGHLPHQGSEANGGHLITSNEKPPGSTILISCHAPASPSSTTMPSGGKAECMLIDATDGMACVGAFPDCRDVVKRVAECDKQVILHGHRNAACGVWRASR